MGGDRAAEEGESACTRWGGRCRTWPRPGGFSVVREYVGHAIGTAMHEQPQVPNYWPGNRGPRSRRVWCSRSSPWSTPARPRPRMLDDGWSVVTADGRLSAHFEHTIAVTPDGPGGLHLGLRQAAGGSAGPDHSGAVGIRAPIGVESFAGSGPGRFSATCRRATSDSAPFRPRATGALGAAAEIDH